MVLYDNRDGQPLFGCDENSGARQQESLGELQFGEIGTENDI